MCSTRLEGIRWLAEYLQEQIPALDGRVCEVQGEPGHQMSYPSLAITPVNFTYQPGQASFEYARYADRVVLDVGDYEGLLQLRLTTATLGQRYTLEEEILKALLETPLAPGTLTGQVTTCEEYGPFYVSFELNETDWDDRFAADRKYQSVITVNMSAPALTVRLEAYEVTELQLQTSIGTDPEIAEEAIIDEDGNILPVP
jgi:hypothetical protein